MWLVQQRLLGDASPWRGWVRTLPAPDDLRATALFMDTDKDDDAAAARGQ